ncbi:MAG: hypothetical protein Ct9H300mP28_11860 [Pseudomonadota bacterium]|nr:MAG: hypothetical protein Ct9H300mP28_11860 [Pseudomonadota bacterium]
MVSMTQIWLVPAFPLLGFILKVCWENGLEQDLSALWAHLQLDWLLRNQSCCFFRCLMQMGMSL